MTCVSDGQIKVSQKSARREMSALVHQVSDSRFILSSHRHMERQEVPPDPTPVGFSGNWANIANGASSPASPEEQVIQSRGRRRSDGQQLRSRVRKHDTVVMLACRKSPRKPVKPVDFASYFFRSPTPKKHKPMEAPVLTQSPAFVRAKKSYRKRMSLISHPSSPASPSSSSSSSSTSSCTSALPETATGDSGAVPQR